MNSLAFRAIVFLAVLAATPAMATTLTSQDVREGARVPNEQVYGNCNGDNVSPQLAWSGAPAATKSYAVTVFDPDAPGGGWWHWIVFAIPTTRTTLPRGIGNPDAMALPDPAIQGTNDFGSVGYGGPCPPAGDKPHRYEFTLWALDTAKPPFGATVTGSAIAPWLAQHALAKTTLTATYAR